MSASDLGAEVSELRATVNSLVRRLDALTAAHGGESRLKLNAVMRLTSRCKSTIYRDVKNGTFPAPEGWLGRERVWSRAVIEEWMAAQVKPSGPERPLAGAAAQKHAARKARARAAAGVRS